MAEAGYTTAEQALGRVLVSLCDVCLPMHVSAPLTVRAV